MVTRPYLNLLLQPRFFSGFLEKNYNYMHFVRHKIIFFPEKEIIKKTLVPTLPKILRPVT